MKRKLGDLLIEAGAVTQADLDAALSEQSNGDFNRLGEILVASGRVTPTQLARALAAQHGLPFVDLQQVAPKVAALVPAAVQHAHQLVPFKLDRVGLKWQLHVAVADPLSTDVIAEIEFSVQKSIVLHIAPSDEIAAVHRALSGELDEGAVVDDELTSPIVGAVVLEEGLPLAGRAPAAKRPADASPTRRPEAPPVELKPKPADAKAARGVPAVGAARSPASSEGPGGAPPMSEPSRAARTGADGAMAAAHKASGARPADLVGAEAHRSKPKAGAEAGVGGVTASAGEPSMVAEGDATLPFQPPTPGRVAAKATAPMRPAVAPALASASSKAQAPAAPALAVLAIAPPEPAVAPRQSVARVALKRVEVPVAKPAPPPEADLALPSWLLGGPESRSGEHPSPVALPPSGNLLAQLDRMASSEASAYEGGELKPARLLAATVRALIEKGVLAEVDLLDALGKK